MIERLTTTVGVHRADVQQFVKPTAVSAPAAPGGLIEASDSLSQRTRSALVPVHRLLCHGLFLAFLSVIAVEPIIMQLLRRNLVDHRFMPPTHDAAGALHAFLQVEYLLCALGLVLVVLRPRLALRQAGQRLVAGVVLFAAATVLTTRLGERPGDDTYPILSLLVLTAVLVLPRPSAATVFQVIRLWLAVYVYGSLLAALLAPGWALVPVQNGELDPAGQPRLYGLADHPNHLAPLAVLFLVLEVIRRGAQWARALNGLAALATILLTGTLTALVALVAAVACVAISRRSWTLSGLSQRARIGGLAGVIGAVGVLAMSRPEFGKGWHVLLSGDGRTTIWRAAFRVFADYPLVGYGPYVFDEQARLRYLGPQMANLDSAHSQYLQSLAQGGLLMGGALLVLVVGLLAVARRGNSVLGAGGALAVAMVLLVTMLTEVALRPSVPSPFFFFQVAVFLLVLSQGRGHGHVPTQGGTPLQETLSYTPAEPKQV
jgi:O-antigen ligase